jgi:hypothetical protein
MNIIAWACRKTLLESTGRKKAAPQDGFCLPAAQRAARNESV